MIIRQRPESGFFPMTQTNGTATGISPTRVYAGEVLAVRRPWVRLPAGWQETRGPVIVAGTASDSHTWNLVFLQLLIEEMGHEVVNLGSCVPDELLVSECRDRKPALVVISSVNGHGYQDGMRAIAEIRETADLAGLKVVIGGKLGTAGSDDALVRALLDAGFDRVFEGGNEAIASLREFTRYLPAKQTTS
jgi:methylaspartate mutase sigma subunit